MIESLVLLLLHQKTMIIPLILISIVICRRISLPEARKNNDNSTYPDFHCNLPPDKPAGSKKKQ